MNLWLVGFSSVVCTKIRYCCFSHSAPVAARLLRPHCFPPRVCGFPLPALCCSVFRFNPCHPLVECEGECAVCAHVCLSARIYMNACVLCAGSTVVHICVLRQCGALWFPAPTNLDFLLPPLIRLIIFPPPVPAAALILLYRPCFVYSIEDV